MADTPEEIKALADSLDEAVSWDLGACESLTAVPKMFRKMAMKAILKSAKEQNMTVITKEFAESFKPGG